MSLSAAPRRAYEALTGFFVEPVDGRVYALVRGAYALFMLALIAELWPQRIAIASDQGVSAHIYRPLFAWWSYDASPTSITAFMVVASLACVTMALGLFTRLSTFVVFSYALSYSSAGYVTMGGFDSISRIVGWLLLLAPAVSVWSLDGRLREKGQARVPRYPLRLLQFQLLVLYFATVWLKAPDASWRNGELMAYFAMSMFARAPSAWLAQHPALSVVMTWSTLALEVLIPVFLYARSTRLLGLVLGVALHGGIALTSNLGIFSLAMLPMYLAFLEDGDLERLGLPPLPTSSA